MIGWSRMPSIMVIGIAMVILTEAISLRKLGYNSTIRLKLRTYRRLRGMQGLQGSLND
jgi:hypothetical protein